MNTNVNIPVMLAGITLVILGSTAYGLNLKTVLQAIMLWIGIQLAIEIIQYLTPNKENE